MAGRSRRFNFATDAGHRFERGVDPALTVEHIERITQLILDICGGEPGPMDDQTLSLPQLQPVTLRVARAAKVIGMPLTQAQCAEVFHRLGFAFTEGDGHDHRDAAELALRPADRGRPDRGGDPRRRLPAAARHAAAWRRSRARALSESRRSAHAVRHAMAALDYQETINYSFVEERWEQRAGRQRRPDPRAQPDRRAAGGDALQPDRQPGRRAALQPGAPRQPRARVRGRPRVPPRCPGGRQRQHAWPASTSRCAWAGWPTARRRRRNGASKERAVDFFDLKGDIEALLAPRQPRLRGRHAPGAAPGALRARRARRPRPSAMSANCTRAGARPTNCRRRRCCSNWISTPCWRATCRVAQPVPQAAVVVARHRAGGARRRGARRADRRAGAGRRRAWCARCCCSTSTGRRSPARTSAPASAAWRVRLELLDDEANLTDERIDAAVAAAVQRAQARLRRAAARLSIAHDNHKSKPWTP